ncbi:M3 family metallopeptidase [Telmatospirillum sp.]|uniref:M3 family metallopeptidase n=1 Tax=Telmatospirillum sp. TaxID=2079197 RepID=UPI00283F1606|nr:M3 family metallopeptidase [Telmatospirillum sp.]MDR3437358.1 M3 family metallopeptidase [Telmatospirillum sp.]
MDRIKAAFDRLNQGYLAVHKAKEDLFWDTYMAISDDHDGFARAEQAYKDFISAPTRLAEVKKLLGELDGYPASEEKAALDHGLRGWLALFECNIIDNAEAKAHLRDLIDMEAAMFARRRDVVMTHVNEQGETEEASLSMLSTNLGTNRREASRKSSHDALLGLEHWVLDNGFLDIVAKRNALARALGHPNFFDYKVAKNEAMTVAQLFAILDDFEVRTREANQRTLTALAVKKGETALLPFNLRFHMSGDVTRQMDPYLPFGKALERWVNSFRRLGITYRGALMQLDLLERKGKYQNGFCHGPIPAFFDGAGHWVPAQVNFTAEGKPDQVGSGARAINTLFHEGGHAAHFANVTQNAPCFSQEFPPTSMAYAETQSMFCDSLLDDADWLKRYAKDEAGQTIPDTLIRARIESVQPFRAFQERSILVVPYFERALYELADAERTPEAVLALARATERKILGIAVSPRPLLAIPHLLNQESAASYHGYLLANMAVYQTRAYFERTFGYLTDNPAIGPLLARHYWAPGNGQSHDETLRGLTGEGFSARHLAEECNRTVEETWQKACETMAAAEIRSYSTQFPPSLDAVIRIVHGAELLADNQSSDGAMCAAFEKWVTDHFPRGTAAGESKE